MKKTKVVMIDAFKPEYLKYAPYLNSLTKKYQWGELEMPLGHWSGMEIFFKGHSNKLALFYKTEKSSLKWTKYFYWLDAFGNLGRFIIDLIINIFRFLKREELFRTGKIPLKRLHEFDFSVKKPLHNGLNVSYTYFGEADFIGHEYGTKSEEIINAVKELDRKLSGIDFDIILSDHGMSDINKLIKVPQTKNCFIDSDIARYWGNEEELKKIIKGLPMKYGKIINWPEKKYGDLIFLAKTGCLISPNFWQGKKIIKAMHGYDGKHKDMKAFYIIKKQGKKKNLKVKDLHGIFNKMIATKNGRQ